MNRRPVRSCAPEAKNSAQWLGQLHTYVVRATAPIGRTPMVHVGPREEQEATSARTWTPGCSFPGQGSHNFLPVGRRRRDGRRGRERADAQPYTPTYTISRLAAGRIHPNARPGQSGSLPYAGRCERVCSALLPGPAWSSLARPLTCVRSRKDPSLGVDPVSTYPHVSTYPPEAVRAPPTVLPAFT